MQIMAQTKTAILFFTWNGYDDCAEYQFISRRDDFSAWEDGEASLGNDRDKAILAFMDRFGPDVRFTSQSDHFRFHPSEQPQSLTTH